MKLKTTFLLLFYLVITALNLQAQEKKISLYDKNGRLKIDTSYSISKKQLVKFREIEPYLVYNLTHELQYPPQYRRAGVEGITLYSFKVSPAGESFDVKAERIRMDLQPSSLGWVINDTKTLEQSFASKMYMKSLALKNGEIATYYFPVLYTISNETEFKKLELGYLHIQVIKEPIISGDSGPCRGKTKED